MERYQDLKLFFRVYLDVMLDLSGLPEQQRPMFLLERDEEKGFRRARASLKMMLGDVIAQLEHAPEDEAEALAVALEAAGAPSISTVRSLVSKKAAAVLKRGVIRNEEEFYLMKEMLDRSDLRHDDIHTIEQMIHRFEFGTSGENTAESRPN